MRFGFFEPVTMSIKFREEPCGEPGDSASNLLVKDEVSGITLPKFNIALEKLPSQKESSLQTVIFRGLC